tara:strand:- start:282 stop:524 length:243 start_codon:yes stop_codon:yes gene_type:complete
MCGAGALGEWLWLQVDEDCLHIIPHREIEGITCDDAKGIEVRMKSGRLFHGATILKIDPLNGVVLTLDEIDCIEIGTDKE